MKRRERDGWRRWWNKIKGPCERLLLPASMQQHQNEGRKKERNKSEKNVALDMICVESCKSHQPQEVSFSRPIRDLPKGRRVRAGVAHRGWQGFNAQNNNKEISFSFNFHVSVCAFLHFVLSTFFLRVFLFRLIFHTDSSFSFRYDPSANNTKTSPIHHLSFLSFFRSLKPRKVENGFVIFRCMRSAEIINWNDA